VHILLCNCTVLTSVSCIALFCVPISFQNSFSGLLCLSGLVVMWQCNLHLSSITQYFVWLIPWYQLSSSSCVMPSLGAIRVLPVVWCHSLVPVESFLLLWCHVCTINVWPHPYVDTVLTLQYTAHQIIQCCSQVLALVPHAGFTGFKFQPWELGHTPFPSISFTSSLFINYPIIQFYIVWAAHSIVK
jgi:hypothetical protein